MDLKNRLLQQWQFDKAVSVEVGLSGGLDSVVLLHLLQTLRTDLPLTLSAVHVHHGLSPNADGWAEFCRNLCEQWQIPFRMVRVRVDRRKTGIEAAARAERYRIFSDGISDVIALAHHQNDQIETFMLAALRGGGLRALAAMPRFRMLNERISVWRPLLDFSRAELEAYALENGLKHIEDESNIDTAYLRNWLRCKALPQWYRDVPNFEQQILANIDSLQDDLKLLDEIVQQDWQDIGGQDHFDLTKWRTLSILRQRHQLLFFVKTHQLGVPAKRSVMDFCRVLQQIGDGTAQWNLPYGTVHAYHNHLFAVPEQKHYPWHTGLQGRLKDILQQAGFELRQQPFGLPEHILDMQGGIRNYCSDDVLDTSTGRKKIKKILQESHIPPFMRPFWPVVVDENGHSLAVANLKVNQALYVKDGVLPVYRELDKFIGKR